MAAKPNGGLMREVLIWLTQNPGERTAEAVAEAISPRVAYTPTKSAPTLAQAVNRTLNHLAQTGTLPGLVKIRSGLYRFGDAPEDEMLPEHPGAESLRRIGTDDEGWDLYLSAATGKVYRAILEEVTPD